MANLKEEVLIEWIKLCNIKGLGPSKMTKLLKIFGDINAIFSASYNDLLRTRIFNDDMINEFDKIKKYSSEDFAYIIEECKRNNIIIIPFFSDDYPRQLRFVPDPPLNLFALGNLELLKDKKIAIVGSRDSSEKAKKWTFTNAQEIAKKNIVIVSGGAKGIDYEAHNGALSVNGKTICVVGTGFFRMYPEEHKDLFEIIKNKGLILSEHFPDHIGSRISLLRRNRIISGISDGLILVTSSTEGGSMVQLKIAHSQKVSIFCPHISFGLLPNEGIKEAIRAYKAREITDINSVIREIEKPSLFSYI